MASLGKTVLAAAALLLSSCGITALTDRKLAADYRQPEDRQVEVAEIRNRTATPSLGSAEEKIRRALNESLRRRGRLGSDGRNLKLYVDILEIHDDLSWSALIVSSTSIALRGTLKDGKRTLAVADVNATGTLPSIAGLFIRGTTYGFAASQLCQSLGL